MGGLLEDLGPILGVLGLMASTIWKPLENRLDSTIRNAKIMENDWDMAIWGKHKEKSRIDEQKTTLTSGATAL